MTLRPATRRNESINSFFYILSISRKSTFGIEFQNNCFTNDEDWEDGHDIKNCSDNKISLAIYCKTYKS